MSKSVGVKKKLNYRVPPACELSTDDRLRLIANIIIDRIEANFMHRAESKDPKND